MKILCINKDKYVIYLNKYFYKCNKDNISEILSKIFINLKKLYSLEVHSIFNIKCYTNEYYGTILEIEKEYDPFSLYTKKTNANIKFYNDSKFLFEIEDYFTKDKIKSNIYIYNNKYYLEILEDYTKIAEYVNNILYGNKVNDIIGNN